MSLNRFTNIDEVLGYVPVFGETIPMESREALKEYILQLTENDLKGIYDEGDVDVVSEVHIYAGENLIKSYYSNPIDYIGSKLYIQPEKDIRDAGIDQGTYSMVYNFLQRFNGTPKNSDVVVTAISSDRTEVKLAFRAPSSAKASAGSIVVGDTTIDIKDELAPAEKNFSLLRDIYLEPSATNSFNKGGNLFRDFVLNFGDNNLYDIVSMEFFGPSKGVVDTELQCPRGTYDNISTRFLKTNFTNGEWDLFMEVYTPTVVIGGTTNGADKDGKPTGRFAYFKLQETGVNNGYGFIQREVSKDDIIAYLDSIPGAAGNATATAVRNSKINDSTPAYFWGTKNGATVPTSELGVAWYFFLPNAVQVPDTSIKVVNTTAGFDSLTYSRFDTTPTQWTSVVVKLTKPIGNEVQNRTSVAVCGRLLKSYVEKIIVFPEASIKPDRDDFSEPNFAIDVTSNSGNSTDWQTWNSLLDADLTTSQQIINHYFSGSLGQTKLNIDYSDFANFIHFSSATERVDNFVYKLQQIENYNSRINVLNGVSGSEAITNISQSLVRRDRIVGGFDDFEHWMYYDVNKNNYTFWSSSAYQIEPYPKVSTYPHVLRHITSSQAETWYAGVYASASLYDELNDSRLRNFIPIHLQEDEKNSDYITFIDMIGQHFDVYWTYIKALTDINKREEHPRDGMADEILKSVAQSVGWQLSNGYSDVNLWKYALGVESNGTLYQTGSLQSKAREQITHEIWRRIVNNIPLLYKTKGTARSIKSILASYGIPQAFLQIREWGGPAVNEKKNIYENERFLYKLELSKDQYSTHPWGTINNQRPSTIEIIGKMPLGNYHVMRLTSGSDYLDYFWDYDSNAKTARIRAGVNGSDIISSSYVPYKTRRDVVFTIASSSLSINAAMVDDFGYVLANPTASTTASNATLNSLWSVGRGTLRVPGSYTFPSNNYTASIQEVRYYTTVLSNEIVKEHSKNREAYFADDNTTDLNMLTAYDKLLYRIYPDSSFNSASIVSVHPNQKVTQTDQGYVLSASFANVSSSNLVGEVDTQWITIPSVGALNLMNNKIRIESASLKGVLNPDYSVEQSEYDYAPLDSNLLGTYFSTVDTINYDIFNSEGYFEADDWVGDPDERFNDDYPLLKYKARNYFQKYTTGTALDLIMDMLARYDMSVFEQIKQLLPARVDWHKGIMIEPHVFERSKYRRPRGVSYTRHDYSANIDRVLPLVTASRQDYGFGSGSTDGVVDLYNYQASTYKYYIAQLSSSGQYFTTTNGYWEYIPTGSTVLNARPSQNGGQVVNLFYSTQLSASLGIPYSSSYKPAQGSDYQGLALENLKFNGCRVSSDSLTTNSPDTPDGGPVIVVTKVKPNKLVFSTTTAGGGVLDVKSPTGKVVKAMNPKNLVATNYKGSGSASAGIIKSQATIFAPSPITNIKSNISRL